MSDASALHALRAGVHFGGNIRADSVAFLVAHGCAATAGHCAQVAAEAVRLARRFGLDERAAETAALLHDISAVIPIDQRIPIAEQLGLVVLDAERSYPMIVHQRLSAAIAETLFEVQHAAVLFAIACHTTLKQHASALDTLVFVADKITWDQPGDPPYLTELLTALDQSLDAAAFCYLEYLFVKASVPVRVVHPWAWAAYIELGFLLRGGALAG